MKDIPIIFSAPMVRALLEGRKTMTRRLMLPAPEPFPIDDKGSLCEVAIEQIEGDPRPRLRLGRVIKKQEIRYAVGDRLWVREAFMPRPMLEQIAKPHYRADNDRPEWRGLWKPSIHMPRWASRLTLAVTAVKIEQLQAISKDDCIAEGMQDLQDVHAGWHQSFAQLWNALHGDGAWEANPWVIAIGFTVHKTNIHAMPNAKAA